MTLENPSVTKELATTKHLRSTQVIFTSWSELNWEFFGYIHGYTRISDISQDIFIRIYPKWQFHNRYIHFSWIYSNLDMMRYIQIPGYNQDTF